MFASPKKEAYPIWLNLCHLPLNTRQKLLTSIPPRITFKDLWKPPNPTWEQTDAQIRIPMEQMRQTIRASSNVLCPAMKRLINVFGVSSSLSFIFVSLFSDTADARVISFPKPKVRREPKIRNTRSMGRKRRPLMYPVSCVWLRKVDMSLPCPNLGILAYSFRNNGYIIREPKMVNTQGSVEVEKEYLWNVPRDTLEQCN